MKELKRSRICRLMLVSGIAVFAWNFTATANIIVNGSFEAPVFPAVGIYYSAPAGWGVGGTPIIFRGSPPGPFQSPQDGDQYYAIGTASWSVWQVFTVTAPGDYILSWFDNGYRDTESALSAKIDATYAWYTPIDNDNDWDAHSHVVTLSAGNHLLYFTGAHHNGAAIDNVSLEPAPVPEAGTTLGGLALAFTLLGAAAAGQGRINQSSCLGEGGLLHGRRG